MIKKINAGLVVEILLVITKVLSFVKFLREFFFEIKTKGTEGGRVCTRCLIMHNTQFSDLAEMIKEEFSNNKLYIKPQAVEYYDTLVIG